jgi:spore coat polysaccharide biosynthesis predicted glycosyltransferase SpsG
MGKSIPFTAMRIVFRADASFRIGSGHVMRTSAIAQEVISRSIPAVFIGQISEMPWVSEQIENMGFQEIAWEASRFLPNFDQDVLVLDSYELPKEEEFIRPEKWRAIVNIFDELTPQYASKLRVHPGITKHWGNVPGTKTLSGAKYVPLRKSIRKNTEYRQRINPEIVVVGGGSDSTNFTLEIAKILSSIDAQFHVNLFSDRGNILNLDERFSVFPIGSQLDEIANNSDLVFTTASTTSLEFLARGTAVGVGCSVDNQGLYYRELGSGEFVAPIGEFLDGVWRFNQEIILKLVKSETFRGSLRSKSEGLIDLLGSKRIVDEILKL